MNFSTLQRLRAETPGTADCIHLNNAGSALMAQPVFDAVRAYEELEFRLGGYETAELKRAEIDSAYGAVAELLHAKKENHLLINTIIYDE